MNSSGTDAVTPSPRARTGVSVLTVRREPAALNYYVPAPARRPGLLRRRREPEPRIHATTARIPITTTVLTIPTATRRAWGDSVPSPYPRPSDGSQRLLALLRCRFAHPSLFGVV